MLTQAEIRTVQGDWETVAPLGAAVATKFYARLFELDPSLRRMFSSDMSEQERKLVRMLGTAVKGLDDLESLVPAVQDLGRRHVGYGVKAAHYSTVGSALLGTLRAALGPKFDASHEAAWTKVYQVLADTMQKA